jgi:hypothetical protein
MHAKIFLGGDDFISNIEFCFKDCNWAKKIRSVLLLVLAVTKNKLLSAEACTA